MASLEGGILKSRDPTDCESKLQENRYSRGPDDVRYRLIVMSLPPHLLSFRVFVSSRSAVSCPESLFLPISFALSARRQLAQVDGSSRCSLPALTPNRLTHSPSLAPSCF
jgi:hypothetical protein